MFHELGECAESDSTRNEKASFVKLSDSVVLHRVSISDYTHQTNNETYLLFIIITPIIYYNNTGEKYRLKYIKYKFNNRYWVHDDSNMNSSLVSLSSGKDTEFN